MGKKEKEHRKKVAKRNERIKQEQKKNEKIGFEFLKRLIESEKMKGLFNNEVQPLPNSTAVTTPTTENSTESENLIGPQI